MDWDKLRRRAEAVAAILHDHATPKTGPNEWTPFEHWQAGRELPEDDQDEIYGLRQVQIYLCDHKAKQWDICAARNIFLGGKEERTSLEQMLSDAVLDWPDFTADKVEALESLQGCVERLLEQAREARRKEAEKGA